MLETIRLDLSETCKPGMNALMGQERTFIGQTYAFSLHPLIAAVVAAGENLDTFLCKRLLKALSDKPIKNPQLFWYAPHAEFAFITACDKKLTANYHPWLGGIPGYAESGQDYVRPNSKPFLRWDGKNLIRLYELPPDYKSDSRYLSDCGGLFGLTMRPVDANTYEAIEASPSEHWDLSCVPQQGDQIVTVEGKKLVLSHTFWTL